MSARARPGHARSVGRRPEIAKVLVVSTGHVTKPEADLIEGVFAARDGWFMWVPKEGAPCALGAAFEPSEGLQGVLRAARKHGCSFIRFDVDGDYLDGVANYVW